VPASAEAGGGDFYQYDEGLRRAGAAWLAGLDEAGRGPIAGPVVAAAVVLPSGRRIAGLRDSKQLSAEQRRALFFEVVAVALDLGVGVSDHALIDRINVLEATRAAMCMALDRLARTPDRLVIDAVRLSSVRIPHDSPFKGESVSASVAAASIIAKVYRDAVMDHYDTLYPGYGFARHKGYGTRDHMEALDKLGPSPIHRRSYGCVSALRLPF
jgi:ribonuclease HII